VEIMNAKSASLVGLAILGKRNEPMYLCDCRAARNDSEVLVEPTGNPTDTSSSDDPFGFRKYFPISSDVDDSNNRNVSNQQSLPQQESLSLDYQLMMYASLDMIEEMMGSVAQTHEYASTLLPPLTSPLKIASDGRSVANDDARASHAGEETLEEISSSSIVLPKTGTVRGMLLQQHLMLHLPNSNASEHWMGHLTRFTRNSSTKNSTIRPGGVTTHHDVYGYISSTNIKFLALVESHTPTPATPMAPGKDRLMNSRVAHQIESFLVKIQDAYVEYITNSFNNIAFPDNGKLSSTRFDRSVRDAIRHYEFMERY
jgi:hypothetical protein